MIKIQKYKLEIFCILGCLLLSNLIGYSFMSKPLGQWYMLLEKPSFNPPSYVFGPVWTVLYICMGVVLGQLLKDGEKNKKLLILFGLQFALNMAWTPLFFGLESIDWALIDLTVLWLVVLMFLLKVRKDRLIAGLFIPYFLWLSYAWILNVSIYLLNS